MADTKAIHKSLLAKKVDEQLIGQIIDDGDIVGVIQRMDELLDANTKYIVLDSCACCTKTSKARDKQCKDYGKAMDGKPLTEKINGLSGIDFGCVTLNEDNTLSIKYFWDVNGKKSCSCGAIKGITVATRPSKDIKCPNDDRIMPLSYCLCCAGHFRYHLQNALHIKLKTKEIVSSPINSRCEKPCEFILEIIE